MFNKREYIVVQALTCLLLLGGQTTYAQEPGSVVAWGCNDCGQAEVPPQDTGYIAVDVGHDHSLGLRDDGSIDCWGNGPSCPRPDYGACDVPASAMDVVSIAAGSYFSLALLDDGTIVDWGTYRPNASTTSAPGESFESLAAGHYHGMALDSDGVIACWGSNREGQCDVPSPNSGFIAIDAGHIHSLGLKTDHSIVAWGCGGASNNDLGQCDPPPGTNDNFIAVAAGGFHSLGLKFDGSIVAWGDNRHGELDVPSPNTGFVSVAAGWVNSAGLRDDGSIEVWGHNACDQNTVPSRNTCFSAVVIGHNQTVLAIRHDADGNGICDLANNPPIPDAGGPYEAECTGETTILALDGGGSYDPDGDALTFDWQVDCLNAWFDDPAAVGPVLNVGTAAGCNVTCQVTLTVNDGLASVSDSTSVAIHDTLAPALTLPPDIAVGCLEGVDPMVTGQANAADQCDAAPTISAFDVLTPTTCPGDPVLETIERTWTATDTCGNAVSDTQTIQIEKLVVDLDIKPGSCPNSFTPKAVDRGGKYTGGFLSRTSGGVVPVALLGSDAFDASAVDVGSLVISRADCVGGSVYATRWSFADVATPDNADGCGCHTLRGDGFVDLELKFDASALTTALALDSMPGNSSIPLVLSGTLLNGCSFMASDCIRITPAPLRNSMQAR